jgi:riboflavin biosynthesis pyrimidine reductase
VNPTVLRLFPAPHAVLPLEGLYLAHELHRLPDRDGTPFLYTNFISSLDGRISSRNPVTGLRDVPPEIANAHDWRLFLELAAQADVLLTTARHLRSLVHGRHQELFAMGANRELAAWRCDRHLSAQPAIAALSEGLDIPVDAVRAIYDGPLLVITGRHAPASRVAAIRAAGIEVLQLPTASALEGQGLAQALSARGYRSIYSIAGPRVTHALLAAGVIGRLYLTFAQVALGGRDFDTLTLGDSLAPPRACTLQELYLDSQLPAGAGQLFATFALSTNTSAPSRTGHTE